jgi:cobalt-zinc-cadmium efflux system outer membrane protein
LRTLLYCILCLVPGLAPAQPPPLTVDEAVALAIQQNPRLAAAAGEVAAARFGVRSAGALTNPSITFTPGLTPGGSDEEFLAQQPLELNGTRKARRGIAQAQLRRTQAEAVVALRDLVLSTRTAYYELARTRELRSLTQDVLRTAEEFHRGVRRQAEEGLRPEIDPVQTEIEVNRARQQLTLAESQVATAQVTLNTLLGRSPSEPVTVQPLLAEAGTPAAREPVTLEPIDREQALRQALAARAEITAEEAQRDEFRQQARLARAEGRPDLVPQLRVGSVTRGIADGGVGIGISLPFLDYGARRNRVRQADASARAQDARITAAQNQVRQEVTQAAIRLEASAGIVRQYQQGVLAQARRLLDASLRALQLGAPGASILSVLEAQRTYRGVVTEYTTSLADYARARAELERATGAVPAALLPEISSPNQGGTSK